jgi:phosphopantothenoylcysteine decarboxylase/phosphopantothenate--cysteine ligase
MLPVDEGALACGDEGAGRLVPVETLVDYVLWGLRPQVLAGKRVLISSGPTTEPIDAVRVITNRSSGKMGAMLARAAQLAGADVCVVTGPASVQPPWGCRVIPVTSTLDMKAALTAEFTTCDICIMAAAVSDFRPSETFAGKKHRSDSSTLTLSLTSNPDILAGLGATKTHQVLVGFSLDRDENQELARAKMAKKNCDIMIANPVETSMESDETSASILVSGKPTEHTARLSKRELAEVIVDRIALLTGNSNV